MPKKSVLLSPYDVAKRAGLTGQKVHQDIASGRIVPAFLTPTNRALFTEEECRRYIAARKAA
jgi:hypothetical protein